MKIGSWPLDIFEDYDYGRLRAIYYTGLVLLSCRKKICNFPTVNNETRYFHFGDKVWFCAILQCPAEKVLHSVPFFLENISHFEEIYWLCAIYYSALSFLLPP